MSEVNELEKAKAVVEAEKKIRGEQCAEKINAALNEFNCVIDTNADVVINGQKVTPIIKPL